MQDVSYLGILVVLTISCQEWLQSRCVTGSCYLHEVAMVSPVSSADFFILPE